MGSVVNYVPLLAVACNRPCRCSSMGENSHLDAPRREARNELSEEKALFGRA